MPPKPLLSINAQFCFQTLIWITTKPDIHKISEKLVEFHYTWAAAHMNFHGVLFLRMEITFFISPPPPPPPPPPDKMAAISQTIFSVQFREWQVLYFDQNVAEVCA